MKIVPEILFASAIGGPTAVSALLSAKASKAGLRWLGKNGISKEDVDLANQLFDNYNSREIEGGALKNPFKKVNWRNLGVNVLKGLVSTSVALPVGIVTGNPFVGAAAGATVGHFVNPKIDKLKGKGVKKNKNISLGGSMIALGNGFKPLGE